MQWILAADNEEPTRDKTTVFLHPRETDIWVIVMQWTLSFMETTPGDSVNHLLSPYVNNLCEQNNNFNFEWAVF